MLSFSERWPPSLRAIIRAQCFLELVTARRGDPVARQRALRGGLEPAGEAGFLSRFVLLRGKLAACLGKAGEVSTPSNR